MKRRATRGTFVEQKARHIARQRLFDAIVAAKERPCAFRFGRLGVRSRPDLENGTHAVVAIRRGYALVAVGEEAGKVGDVLASVPRTRSCLRNGFSLDHLVFWCEVEGRTT